MDSRRRALMTGSVIAGLMIALAGVATAVPPENATPTKGAFSVAVVSTKADMVTGGDALVRIDVPGTVPPHQVRVSVDGRDVTGAFAPVPKADRTLLGVVDGLEIGDNTIEVVANTNSNGPGRPSAELVVVNHPTSGPVLSGPHQTPFICQTEAFGLGPALDDNCSAHATVAYVYRTIDGRFAPLDPDAPTPADLTQTTTLEGDTVDYIVRVETGTINRAVYQIAMLHQPRTPLPDPWTDTKGWNNRLVYTFGGGCAAGHRQGSRTGGVLNDGLLSPGFAVVSASQNVFGNNCNDVISAETAMMVKEHFVEAFGADEWTIGFGGSGGSMQQHLIAQNYPGILDGIVPQRSYPDITSMITPISDCSLISRATKEGGQPWTLEQVSAVTGFANNGDMEACELWANIYRYSTRWIAPAPCPDVIPTELVYDPDTNPEGTRCAVHDNTVNVFGLDPETGFARRPLDNVGVQYGLEAFNEGVISFEQFAELNELVGGYDVDGNHVAERTVADSEVVRIAYQTGRINSGAGGLADIPIIDVRGYHDVVDIHDRFRSFSTRERLIATNGHADNHVIWISDTITPCPPCNSSTGDVLGGEHQYEAVLLMDEWLAAVAEDRSDDSPAEKVMRNKPAGAVDTCWTSAGEPIVEPATLNGPGACNKLYPSHADPRLVAGAPVANDVLKCQLQPITAGNYTTQLTRDQLGRLREIFPDGVCAYANRGVGQQPLVGTWRRY